MSKYTAVLDDILPLKIRPRASKNRLARGLLAIPGVTKTIRKKAIGRSAPPARQLNALGKWIADSPKLLAAVGFVEPGNWNAECLELAHQLVDQCGPQYAPQFANQGLRPGYNCSWFASYGQREEPWFTGAGTDGYRKPLIERDGEIGHKMALANYLARPDKYDFNNVEARRGGYGDGWRTYSSVLQGQDWGNGVKVYGHDYEHVIVEDLLEVCRSKTTYPITLTVNGGAYQTDTVTLARGFALFIRKSVCGQMRAPWSQSNRPSDRVAGRLLYAMLRLVPYTGLDGADETAFWSFLDLVLKCWIDSGPWTMAPPDTRGLACVPPVHAPYMNPVHSYSYVLCSLYWILRTCDPKLAVNGRSSRINFLLMNYMPVAMGLMGAHGEFPWVVGAAGSPEDGIAAFPANSDGSASFFTATAEVCSTAHLGAKLGVDGAQQKAANLVQWLRDQPETGKNWQEPWAVDADDEMIDIRSS